MFRRLLSILFCSLLFSTATAAELVEGRVYLKNGTVIECKGNDRLQIPKKGGDLKIFRDAFRKTKRKEVVAVEEIDTVLCWHTKTPQHVHRFVFASAGVDADLLRNAAHKSLHLLEKRLRHRGQRRGRFLAAEWIFQPLARGFFPAKTGDDGL